MRSIGGYASFIWRALESGGAEAVSFIFFLTAAKILLPNDFGVMAIALSITGILQTALQHGYAEVVIQSSEMLSHHLRVLVIKNFAWGLILGCSSILISLALAGFSSLPGTVVIVCSLAPLLAIQGASFVLQAVLRRVGDFRSVALRGLASSMFAAICGITAAKAGAGVWALVIQQWSAVLGSLVVVLWAIGRRSIPFGPSRLMTINFTSEARPVMLANLISNGARKTDSIVIGTILGAHWVGIYFLVARVVSSMQLLTQYSLIEVSLVSLSRVSLDRQAHIRLSIKSLRLTTLVCSLGFGLIVVAGPAAVSILFGIKWVEAEYPLRILSLFAVCGAVVGMCGNIMISMGKGSSFSKLSLGYSLITVIGLAVGATHSIALAMVGLGVGQLVSAILAINAVSNETSVPQLALFKEAGLIYGFSLISVSLALWILNHVSLLAGPFIAAGIASLTFLIMAIAGYFLLLRYGMKTVSSISHT